MRLREVRVGAVAGCGGSVCIECTSPQLAHRSLNVLFEDPLIRGDPTFLWSLSMEHDLQLRAAARAIYDVCYPSGEWAPVGFDEAERYCTTHYRQAVDAAQQARMLLAHEAVQPMLFPLKSANLIRAG